MINLSSDVVKEMLKGVEDPELGINIVDLGLIYDVEVTPERNIEITMTLTSPGCPLGPEIEKDIRSILEEYPGVGKVNIHWVWSPPWDPRQHASEDARLELGLW